MREANVLADPQAAAKAPRQGTPDGPAHHDVEIAGAGEAVIQLHQLGSRARGLQMRRQVQFVFRVWLHGAQGVRRRDYARDTHASQYGRGIRTRWYSQGSRWTASIRTRYATAQAGGAFYLEAAMTEVREPVPEASTEVEFIDLPTGLTGRDCRWESQPLAGRLAMTGADEKRRIILTTGRGQRGRYNDSVVLIQ
jgi:hypothetical protein